MMEKIVPARNKQQYRGEWNKDSSKDNFYFPDICLYIISAWLCFHI